MVFFLVVIVTLTLTRPGVTRRVEWTDDDTIIVEATREDEAPNAVFERNDIPFFYHAPIPSLLRRKGSRVKRAGYVHTCYSVLGDQGHCTTFNQCFPMLYHNEGEHKGQIKHPVLADLLMSTSGPCLPPPLSFRDDFVPYDATEDELTNQQPPSLADLDKRKDLICCPSNKPTPIPPSAEGAKVTMPQLPPYIERFPMRTTPSTMAHLIKSTTAPSPSKGTQDAVAGFLVAEHIPTGDAAPPQKNEVTAGKPVPTVGQWGHRFPTRSTTPLPLWPNENDITDGLSESDESEEQKVLAIKPSMVPPPPKPPIALDVAAPFKKPSLDVTAPFKKPSLDVTAPFKKPSLDATAPFKQPSLDMAAPYKKPSADVAMPQWTFPPPSGSVAPAVVETPGVDASVPVNSVAQTSRPTPLSKLKRPISAQDPTAGDVYVPVIAVGSMTPDDPMIMSKPSTPLVNNGGSSPPKLSSIQNATPKPIPPDAAPMFNFQATKVQLVSGPAPSSAPASQVTHVDTTVNETLKNTEINISDPSVGISESKVTTDNADVPEPIAMSTDGSLVDSEVTTTLQPEPVLVTTVRPKLPLVMDKAPCGIINTTTDPKYPWVAAIKLGPKYICAGSVIDEYHILTSAACVSHLSTVDIGNLRVYLGERILNSYMDGPTIVRKVKRAMRHRGFSVTTLRHDIALLKLSLPIPIGTKRVKPVCLPLEDDSDLMLETSSEANIVGWGSAWNKVQNDITHESRLAVWTKDACLDKYRFFIPDTHFDDEDMICAQHMGPTAKTSLANPETQEVESDGSPLIVKGQSGIYQQIGISSWKLGSLSTFPRVLTRVSAYRHWIEKNRLRP